MYTSMLKTNDRFGFHESGTFRVAYGNTTLVIIICMCVIGAILVLLGISFFYLVVKFSDASASSAASFNDLIFGNYEEMGKGLFNDLAYIGFVVSGIQFGIMALAFAVIIFVIIMATLKMGMKYKFRADDRTFTIIYPEKYNRTIEIEYDYIIGIKSEEWRFPFAPKCIIITIETKEGDFTFRCVHTPMSRVNGLCETPFNIIREKIGVTTETDIELIHLQEQSMKRGT